MIAGVPRPALCGTGPARSVDEREPPPWIDLIELAVAEDCLSILQTPDSEQSHPSLGVTKDGTVHLRNAPQILVDAFHLQIVFGHAGIVPLFETGLISVPVAGRVPHHGGLGNLDVGHETYDRSHDECEDDDSCDPLSPRLEERRNDHRDDGEDRRDDGKKDERDHISLLQCPLGRGRCTAFLPDYTL